MVRAPLRLALSLAVLGLGCSHPTSNGSGGGGGAAAGGGASGGGGGATGGGAGGGTGGGTATGGGTGTGGGGFTGDGGSYTCDVQGIVETRCLDCHSNPPRFGAPMSLASWADTQATSAQYPGQKVYQRMAFRVADAAAPMPQPPNAPLTQEQVAAVQNWAAAGAPEGDASCTPDGGYGGGSGYDGGTAACPTGTTALDYTAPAFPIPAATDFYQCFAFTVSLPQKEHVVQVDKIIGDPRVLHHMVVFRDTAKSSPMSQSNCGFKATWEVLYAWAPGTGPFEPPPDVGIPVNDGDQLVIQLHYNNAMMVTGTDASGVRLCATTTLRQREAGVLAIGPASFSLPPNCSQVSVSAGCHNFLSSSYDVFTVWPHMHVKGRAQQTTLTHSGQTSVVEDRPNYSFGSQYLEASNFTFASGDDLKVKCTWDTTGATAVTKWGEATSDEMCFNFLYVTPPPPVAYCPALNTTSPVCVP